MTILKLLVASFWMMHIMVTFAKAECNKLENVLMSDCDGECDVACVIYSFDDYDLCEMRIYDQTNWTTGSGTTIIKSECDKTDSISECLYECYDPFSETEIGADDEEYKVFRFVSSSTSDMIYSNIPSSVNIINLTFPDNVTNWKIIESSHDGVYSMNLSERNFTAHMFESAKNLRRLSVHGIDFNFEDVLENLPEEMLSLTASASKINSIPEKLSRLSALETLSLDHNSIQMIPTNVIPPSIVELDLSSNNLTSFEGSLPPLKLLNLSHNHLELIPSNLEHLYDLQTLDVNENPISDRNVSKALFDVLNGSLIPATDFSLGDGKCQNGSIEFVPHTSFNVCVAGNDTSSSSGGKSFDSSSLVPLYVVIPVVVILAVAGYMLHRRCRNQKDIPPSGSLGTYSHSQTPSRRRKGDEPTTPYGQHYEMMSSIWKDSTLRANELRPDKIHPIRRLGVGAFGEVWLVQYFGEQLASKRLIKSKADIEAIENFINETKLSAALEHPHILMFVGVAFTKKTDFQAVYEYMERGDLRSYLKDGRVDRHWDEEKMQIAIDVADALVYLHSFSPAYIHRDLKSRNVLLSEDMVAKIGDFGTARTLNMDRTLTTKGVGTIRWLAPEILREEHEYDESSDIYSFGAILIELDTHMLPYADVVPSDGKQSNMMSLSSNIANGTVRPSFSSSCPASIRLLGVACLDLDPSKRPTGVCVQYALRCILQSGTSLDLNMLQRSLGLPSIDSESTVN